MTSVVPWLKDPGQSSAAAAAVALAMADIRTSKWMWDAVDRVPCMGADEFIEMASLVGGSGSRRRAWIQQACDAGHAELLGAMLGKRWLAEGAEFDAAEDGGDCMRAAVKAGSVECVRILLGAGVGVDARSRLKAAGDTPLMAATLLENPEMVNFLIAAGADVEAMAPSGGRSALALVAWPGGTRRRSMVSEALLAAVADWWSPGKSEQGSVIDQLWIGGGECEAVLDLVLERGPSLGAEALVSARAALDRKTWRTSGNIDQARGALPPWAMRWIWPRPSRDRDRGSSRPRRCEEARRRGMTDGRAREARTMENGPMDQDYRRAAEIQVAQSAALGKSLWEAREAMGALTATKFLEWAEAAGLDAVGRAEWVKQACKAGADGNLTEMADAGWLAKTPIFDAWAGECLRLAATSGSVECVKILFEAGVDANLPGAMGQTGLTMAAAGSDPEMIQAFLDAGAGLEAKSRLGRTPLALAAHNVSMAETPRRVEARDLLLEAGADWWSPGKNGDESVLGMLWDGLGDYDAAMDLIRWRAVGLGHEALSCVRNVVDKEPRRGTVAHVLAELARSEALAMVEAGEITASVKGRRPAGKPSLSL